MTAKFICKFMKDEKSNWSAHKMYVANYARVQQMYFYILNSNMSPVRPR